MTVKQFLDRHTITSPGSKVRLTALYNAYQRFLPPEKRTTFSKRMFCDALDKLGVIRGLATGSQVYCANLSLAEKTIVKSDDGRLVSIPFDPLSEFLTTRQELLSHE